MKRLLDFILLLFSSLFLVMFFALALYRIGGKLPNGPFEDLFLQGAMRILEGLPLYVDASVHFVSSIYAPLYFYLSALCISLVGSSLFATRLPSLLANGLIIPTFYLIFRQLFPERKRSDFFSGALLCSGLFFASYGLTGFWLDLAKVDSLFVLVVLFSLYWQLRCLAKEGVLSALILGIVTASLLFIKQTGLIFIPLNLLLFFLFREYRKMLFFLLASAVSLVVPILLLSIDPDSRYLHYNFVIPAEHVLENKAIIIQAFQLFWPLCCIVLAGAFIDLKVFFAGKGKAILERRFSAEMKTVLILLGYLAASLLISYAGRMKMGAVSNSWLYFYAIAVLVSVYYFYSNRQVPHHYHILTGVFLLFQMVWALYDPVKPYKQSRYRYRIQDEYVHSFCNIGPEVMNQNQSYLATLFCGKKGSFFYISAIDILYDSEQIGLLDSSLHESVKEREYPYILSVLPYDRAFITEQMRVLNDALLTEKRGKKRRQIESNLRGMGMELYYRTMYETLPEESMSPDEKRFVEMERNLLQRKVFILKLKNHLPDASRRSSPGKGESVAVHFQNKAY